MTRRMLFPCLAGAAVAACGPRAKQLPALRVSLLPRFVSAPVYLAEEAGYFREAGLRLEIIPMTATAEMMPLLAAGKLDVAFAGAIPAAMNAIANGAKLRIVAAREMAAPGCIHEIYGNRKSFPQGLHDLGSLKGKRIAVSGPASLSGFLLDTLLDSVKLHTGDIKLLKMRVSESLPALIAGNIDAVVDEDMEFSLPDVVAGPGLGDILPGLQYSFIYFGSALLEGDRERGASFLTAYLRGVAAFRAGQTPQAIEKLADATASLDPAVVERGCRTRFTQDGAVDLASVQKMIDWSVKRQFLPAPLNAAEAVDTRFLEGSRRRNS
jgi:ABC-type nitrate/sulfonate/bicarbonate transport system substrate-binding protein